MKTNTLKWISNVVGAKKINVLVLALFHGLLGASGVWYALLLRNGIDSASDGDKNGFYMAVFMAVSLVLGQILLRALTRWLEEKSRSEIENIFKSRLFKTILHKDYASVTAVHSGEWLNRLTSDTKISADGVVDIFPGLVGMAVKMVGAFFMLVVIEPKFVFLLVPCGGALIVLTYVFRKVLKKLHKSIQESDGNLRIFLQEHLGSLMIVKSFCVEKNVEECANKKMKMHKSARMKRNYFSNVCNIGFSVAMNGMYLLGFAYCGTGIISHTVTYGTLTAVLQLISQIQNPLANITGYLPKFYSMTASAERLSEVEKFPDATTKKPLEISQIQNLYEGAFEKISAKNLSFSYDEKIVLKNVSCEIIKGENIALMGHSGCGKSTFLKLLMGMYHPSEGEILLNGCDDFCDKLDGKYQRLFAYVPQGNHLMNGTIKDVITFSQENVDEQRLENALKISCADEFVSRLENGVETVLGERGSGLSEGQMQRIAIARAIYSSSPVLLLDEATSALDEMTEKQLLENLKEMTKRTVLIVTHRPQALKICNKIFRFTANGVETEIK